MSEDKWKGGRGWGGGEEEEEKEERERVGGGGERERRLDTSEKQNSDDCWQQVKHAKSVTVLRQLAGEGGRVRRWGGCVCVIFWVAVGKSRHGRVFVSLLVAPLTAPVYVRVQRLAPISQSLLQKRWGRGTGAGGGGGGRGEWGGGG